MKQPQVREASTEELQEELVKSKKAYSELRMAHSLSPLENPMQLRSMRKSIARIATELTKRELNA
ncbi:MULTISPECIES: 50S ribosomal protein L29 [Croceibacter]|jgi:large subunit ribosomal protein L29|nr:MULTISPECIES: 50S ribosomal protein L29 [Croceibacter]MAM22898.1 50S ribosomal protein L29 [Croceibacter sp.]MBG25158.1 50S ribosomal protein L29 [Croceibacter sp.]MBW4969621.1 50S ribosomal protein L29 [Croceibacter atlanticus]WSP33236.1 50S ribosomal protein L29 [Croceibacter atlanticus]|tara:strand:+ start:389 stop:583 length:195 start_codon:yes stop_codon:yes gene_type:complete